MRIAFVQHSDSQRSSSLGYQLSAGAEQAARDRGLEIVRPSASENQQFYVEDARRFLWRVARERSADGIVTTLYDDTFLEPLIAAGRAGIPVYITGGLPATLMRAAQQLGADVTRGALGPMGAGIVTLAVDEDLAARQLAERLLARGIRRIDCMLSDEQNVAYVERCRTLVASFQAGGRSGASHVQARALVPMVLAVGTFLADTAAREPSLRANEMAIVVMDTVAYALLKEVKQLRGDIDSVHLAVFESSVEVVRDAAAGAPVTFVDQYMYSQGYAAVALAAFELQTDRVLASGLSSSPSIYSTGEVTQADVDREVCRQEGFPVCGDPGVLPVTVSGCKCFNRSDVVIQVLSEAPATSSAQRAVLDGINQAKGDFPGSTVLWDPNVHHTFSLMHVLAVTEGAIKSPRWTAVFHLDHYLVDLSKEFDNATRRLGAATGPDRSFWMLGDMDESVATPAFLDKYGATAYVGPTKAAWAGLAEYARANMDGDSDGLMLYMPIFYLPKWAQTSRAFVDGFTNFTARYPASFWRPPIQGDPVNGTGVFSTFYNGWSAPGMADVASFGFGLAAASDPSVTAAVAGGAAASRQSMRIFPAPTTSEETSKYEDTLEGTLRAMANASIRFLAVQPIIYDKVPGVMGVMEDVGMSARTQLVSLLCTPVDYQAMAYPTTLRGGNRLAACVDWQMDLAFYVAYMGAVLRQHTREKLFDGEVPTHRLVTPASPSRSRARTANCKLFADANRQVAGVTVPAFPLCDYAYGCGNASNPCSGRGECKFPTAEDNARSNAGLLPLAGWCVCKRGARGTLCEQDAAVGGQHALLLGMLVAAGCLLGLLSLVFVWVCCTKGRGAIKGLAGQRLGRATGTKKRSPPGWGEHVALVMTDVQGAAELWEWDPETMQQALQLYHRVLRVTVLRHHGYEAHCDGDKMTFVFHDASEALHFAVNAQAALLEPEQTLGPPKSGGAHPPLPNSWPYRLLSHPLGQEVAGRDCAVLYKGLRVRVAVHAGVPGSRVQSPSGHVEYSGSIFDVARAIRDAPQGGGQVLVSMDAWAALGTATILGDMPLMVLSLGEHRLSADLPPLQLLEVLPQTLQERLPFKPIQSLEQLSPSFFDAPASSSHVAGSAPTTPIAIMFTFVGGITALKNNPSLAPATALLVEYMRSTLRGHRGYECEEKDGNFLLAFGDPKDAALFSQEVQVGAMDLPWSRALLEEEAAAEVLMPQAWDPDDRLAEPANQAGAFIFRGLRMKIGIYWDIPTRCMPHASTGRAAYFGPLMNRAARIASTAASGQTLCNAALVAALQGMGVSEDELGVRSLGHFSLKGLAEQMELFQVTCARTRARTFPKIQSFRRLPTGITAVGQLLARRETQDYVDIIPAWIPSGVPSLSRKPSDVRSDSGSDVGKLDALVKQASGKKSVRGRLLGPLDPSIWCDTGSGRYLSRDSSEWRSTEAAAMHNALAVDGGGRQKHPGRLSLDPVLRVLPKRPFALFETTMAKKISLPPADQLNLAAMDGPPPPPPAVEPASPVDGQGVADSSAKRGRSSDPGNTGKGARRSTLPLGDWASWSKGKKEREPRWEVEDMYDASNRGGAGVGDEDAGYVVGKKLPLGFAPGEVDVMAGSDQVPAPVVELLQDASFHGLVKEVAPRPHVVVSMWEGPGMSTPASPQVGWGVSRLQQGDAAV